MRQVGSAGLATGNAVAASSALICSERSVFRGGGGGLKTLCKESPGVLVILGTCLALWAVLMVLPAQAQVGGLRLPKAAETEIRPPQLSPPEQPLAPGAVQVPESAPTRAPAGAEQVKFVLTGLDVEGVTAYSKEAVDKFYSGMVGKQISLADIYGVAEEIQRVYRKDGYFLARVIIPAQTSTEGRLRIKVFEGYINEVVVEGNVGSSGNLIKSYLQGITRERPLTLKTLERYLLLANDIPGMSVKGTLRPAADVIAAAQLIATVERNPWSGMFTLDNLGSSFTGVWETSASASLNSITPYGDQWTIGALASDPFSGYSGSIQKVFQGRVSFRPWSSGFYLRGAASWGESNPGGTIAVLDVVNNKVLFNMGAGYPIIRSRDLNLFAELGFDYINSDTDIFSNTAFSRDRLRVLSLSIFGDSRDSLRGANFWNLAIRQGLPILEASKPEDELISRQGGSGTFMTANLQLSRTQKVYGDFDLLLKAAGQYAFSNTLSDEQFGIGGYQFGRGFNLNEITGDHGIGFTTELQYTRQLDYRYFDHFQLFTFYDVGRVWDRTTDDTVALASGGGGVRAWFPRGFALELAIAKPLIHVSQRADGTREAQILFRTFAQF